MTNLIRAVRHDAREPLPFEDNSFDCCYSHMLFCMALTTAELEPLSAEIRRVLRPGGVNVYTVRHTGDAHGRTGIHRGEEMYEVVSIDEFEEGGLPRKLYRVTLRRPDRG